MKKLQILFYLFLSLAIISSCDLTDDDDDDNDDDTFSELSVEENKQKLEDDGLAMLDKMKEMESTAAVDAVASMIHFMELADPFAGNPNVNSKKSGKLSYLKPFVAVKQMPELGYKPVMLSLKSVNEDPESIQEAYDMLVGIYAWNSSSQAWDYTETGDAIVFQFPSTEEGTSNNASLTASDYRGYTGGFDYDLDEYTGDLPEHIKVELKVDNSALMTFEFNATYNSNGEPTDVSSSISMDAFSMSASMYNHSNTEAGMSTELKYNSEILIAASVDATGNWSPDNIENNTVTVYDTVYEEIWNPETGEWEETDVIWYIEEWTEVNGENILTEGNMTFQVMNTKAVGNAKIKELIEGEKNIWEDDEEEGFDDDAATIAMADLINENVDLKVRYADNNEIIAIAEAYTYDDTYTDYIWNEETYQYEEVEVTEKEIGMRFKFGDGSTIDAETYFEDGFDDLTQEFEDWMDYLEDKWDL